MKYPVVEIFGPTIQGEGIDLGRKTYFVRFAGCDNKCLWCDTKYAQKVEEPKYLTPEEIIHQLDIKKCNNVVLTGGNPCIHDLTDLVLLLNTKGFLISLETQGTFWRDWVRGVDLVTLSPKGPSSGNETPIEGLDPFIQAGPPFVQLKVVIFNDEDMQYMYKVHQAYPFVPFVLQVGTEPGDDALGILSKTRALVARIRDDSRLCDVRVLPQLHVLLWGNKRGV